jgi:glycosyltransferase involved in cell wall biosynthesis
MAERFSIAMYLPHLRMGGAEIAAVRLARSFANQGLELSFILHEGGGELCEMLPPEVRIDTLASHRTTAAFPKLVLRLRDSPPDILLSHMGHNNVAALWARRFARAQTRVIVCQHTVLSAEIAAQNSWQYRLLPYLYRRSLAMADGIVAVSQGVADDLTARVQVPRDRISVINNPVPIEFANSAETEQPDHPWYSDNIPVFVAVGRLDPAKDFPSLLSAFTLVTRRVPARLMILGDGPLRGEILQLAEQYGIIDKVCLRGFVANPFPYMHRSAALVLSSRYEGFGNVLVEAMACGTPVISTACPSGPAEILDGGRYGRLVPVGNPSALAEAMCEILQNDTTSRNPPPRVLRDRAKQFSEERIAAQYRALFDRTMSKAD